MKNLLALLRDSRAVGAVEFALIVPVLSLMIIGIAQMGTLYYANARLGNAVAEGVRLAGLYPTPDNATIKSRIAAKQFGLQQQYLSTPAITTGTDGGVGFIQVSMTYDVPLDFVFAKVKAIKLTQTRRTYVYPT
ncbi:MAG: TadE/TadG family type IV pilus assembly protein [Allosphingosinicella sp.]